jgi:hypothetical protein
MSQYNTKIYIIVVLLGKREAFFVVWWNYVVFFYKMTCGTQDKKEEAGY